MSGLKTLIFILGYFLSINCLKEKNNPITISLVNLYEGYTGKKGTIVIKVDTTQAFDNIKDTSKSTCFNAKITDEKSNSFSIDCGFWKAENEDLFIFCNIGENIAAGNYSLNFRETPEISYSDYIITLNQNSDLKFTKYDANIIDLYSDKPTIIVEKNKDNYELKFKISSYNQEPILFSYFFFLDCSQKNDELICIITKKQLESIQTENGAKLYITYISYIGRSKKFPLIPYIDVIYNDIEKTDVYVGITELIENITEKGTVMAYKTNVTDISNVITNIKSFTLDFENINDKEGSCSCAFRKYDDTPLLIICAMENDGTNWLKAITNEKIYNNLNNKYNFRIQPVNNREKIIYHKNGGSIIHWIHPQTLDFTKSDTLIIEYGMEDPSSLIGITFTEINQDLKCQIIGREVKRCTVPKSHFKGLKSGYYFTKHNNHLGTKSTSYEGRPVKVILDDSSKPTDNSKGYMNSFILYYWLLLILISL